MPTQPNPAEGLTPEAIRAHLETILRSEPFADAGRVSAFLRFIVEQTLAGSGDSIKEFVIGTEVFGKDHTFDPKADPIVRVYAGRVRERLQRYYATEGSADRIRIELPKRSYIPLFSEQVTALPVPPVPHKTSRSHVPLIAGVALAVIVATGLAWRQPSRTPVQEAPVQLTLDIGLTTEPSLSADGTLLAYASDRAGDGLDIWLRQMAGGTPVRLTKHPADDREPAISRDGTKVAFRSDRDGGGIYLVPALGGEDAAPARLIAPEGRGPKFSPDGSQIAYWTGANAFSSPGPLFVVESAGGTPLQVGTDLRGINSPLWMPDGKRLIVQGNGQGMQPRTLDWFVVSLDGTPSRRIGILDGNPPAFGRATPSAWHAGQLLFFIRPSRNVEGPTAAHLWRVPLSPGDASLTGPPVAITRGSGLELNPTADASGNIVFAGLRLNRELFAIHSGKLDRLTRNEAVDVYPSISADGRRAAYVSDRTGQSQIWVRDLVANTESAVTQNDEWKMWAFLSPDGRKVVYEVNKSDIVTISADGSDRKVVCPKCGVPVGWSPDSRIISYSIETSEKLSCGFFDLAQGKTVGRIDHPKFSVSFAQFSRDGKFALVNLRESDVVGVLYLVPLQGTSPSPESQWIPLTERTSSAHFPEWSRDGAAVYYISNRDGSYCLWRLPLGPDSRAAGEPVAVQHFHDAHLNLGRRPLPFAVASDRILLSLEETSANLWRMRMPD